MFLWKLMNKTLFKIILDARKKRKLKFEVKDLVQSADTRSVYSRTETSDWSNDVNDLTEFIASTLPEFTVTDSADSLL